MSNQTAELAKGQLGAMAVAKSRKWIERIKFAGIGLLIGLILGIAGTIFVQNYNPEDERQLTASVVFERIVKNNELVSASQNYNITDKFADVESFFDLFDMPWTANSFWYRYVGQIKAGVSLEDAEFSQPSSSLIRVTLSQPYIISNTPNMEKSGVLEENNNILNPIKVEDVDAFQRLCVEASEAEVIEGGLIEEARVNAEQDIRDMFLAALGDSYTVEFEWREAQPDA